VGVRTEAADALGFRLVRKSEKIELILQAPAYRGFLFKVGHRAV
jgi:hypothetical protein